MATPSPSALAQAAGPSISSSSCPAHGQTFTIRGSGFGVHRDDHPNADKLIRVFDDFNDGTLTASPYGSWSVFNGSANPSPVAYSRENPRTSRTGDGHYRRTHVGLGHLSIGAGNRREYYSSFYMRLSDQFDISSASSGTHQFKIIRLFSTNTSGAGKINVYPAIGASDGFHYMFEHIKPEILRHHAQLSAIPNRPTGWHKMAIYYKKSSAPGANDGKCLVWWDNRLVFDWRSHFENSANDPSNVITGDADFDDGDLAGEWSVGNYFSSASTNTWVDFDDIYMSHTLARVEIGNASTYAASTVLETQAPVAWADNQITLQTNLGALSEQQPMYLYVTDQYGNVNASGFPVNTTDCSGQEPYGGTAASLPGTVEAERFDTGAEGVAYHDADAANAGGAFRNTGVDIEPTDDTGGGYNVGWTRPGEWLEYTVNVASAGYYTFDARVASSGRGGTFHVEFDGLDKTGPLAVPDTGGWNNWVTLSPRTGIFLNAGPQVMRISLDTAGDLGWVTELNWVRFTPEDSEPPTVPLGVTATAVSASEIGLSWNASTDNSGVAGYRLDVSTDPSFGSLLAGYSNKNVGNVTQTTVTGLASQTTYYARLRAFDAAGLTSANSASASATTLPPPPECLTATYPSPRSQNKLFDAQTGVFTVVADVTPFASNVNAALGVTSGPQSSWGGLAANVLFFTDGTIKARDGAGYPASTITYAATATYRVRMAIDLATHTYSAYVTAPGGGEQVIGTGLQFRAGQETVTSLDHWMVISDAGSLMACPISVGPTQVVTLQQGLNGYAGAADTWINFYDPNLNFGSDTKMLLLGGTENAKALVRFDLSSIPAGAVISSATLNLYNHSHQADINGGTVSVQQLSKPWVENQATWNVSSAGVNWATPGMQAGADYLTDLETIITIDTAVNVWRNFDVTAMVRRWVSGAVVNNGFVIRSGTSGVKPHFYSSDYLSDPTLRPKLVVKVSP